MMHNNKCIKKLKSEHLHQVADECDVDESFKFIIPENKICHTSLSVSIKTLTPTEHKGKSMD